MAQNLVEKKFSHYRESIELDAQVKNLVMSENFALMSALAKHAKNALSNYSDYEIAALVADKRLTDFKQALSLRNVMSMDSPGTYSWIIHQGQKNRHALGSIPSFDELFASVALPDIINRLPTQDIRQNATYS